MEVEDAKVISEGPKTPPPPPRAAKLEPAGGDSFGVFDGPVKDAANATAAPSEARKKARHDAKSKRTGGKRPGAAAQPAAAAPGAPDPELVKRLKARAKAQQLLKLYEMWQLGQVRGAFGERLSPASLEALCRQMAFTPMELQAMGEPLAEGLVENEIELPWWAEFGIVFGAAVFVRRQQLEQLELKWREQQPANDNKEPSPAPPAPKAA